MKNIVHSPHLELRLKIREIPRSLPRRIYQNSHEHYFDKETGKNIAIEKVRFKVRLREMTVVYEEREDEIRLITVHPLKVLQRIRRIKSGRWQRI